MTEAGIKFELVCATLSEWQNIRPKKLDMPINIEYVSNRSYHLPTVQIINSGKARKISGYDISEIFR